MTNNSYKPFNCAFVEYFNQAACCPVAYICKMYILSLAKPLLCIINGINLNEMCTIDILALT